MVFLHVVIFDLLDRERNTVSHCVDLALLRYRLDDFYRKAFYLL